MKKLLILFVFPLLLLACNDQSPEEQVKNLEGYWEIEQVEFPGDSLRTYKFNETIDYFQVDGKVGFRKKVRPQFDGSYQITDDEEQIELKIEEDELFLYYTTPFTSWKEKVLKAEEDEMELKNEQGLIYHYKRFTPLLNNNYEKEQ
ncbi:hypothetical protein LZ575_05870 [Antarcticibacterium sp. 1MA-6-2]|uniref:lipocalin family protein n=1 Tax=Antarcticibacterium sp. 1MA-6-2 TaxID=2908210 RepID=UPI001F2D81E1|nr:lipocalin family protein [Antarcticibacterium sp. 1MA-6-2]UJH92116.1 hypothetical protein LZ575_05870 [Antarcticibacterium sp. 1MA-6-2]